ncbi:MAG: hypothetical protein L6V35_07605 [Alistipes putredinis]|nr:MAG: hypothetical protein L6V35_07605 [Alistipes putredinis]
MKKTLSLLMFFAVLCIGCTKTDDGGTDKKNDNPTEGISYVGDVTVTQDDGTDFIKKDVEFVMTLTENTMKNGDAQSQFRGRHAHRAST